MAMSSWPLLFFGDFAVRPLHISVCIGTHENDIFNSSSDWWNRKSKFGPYWWFKL